MFKNIWEIIKTFFADHGKHEWAEYNSLYLIMLGIVIAIVLGIVLSIKTKKEINELDKQKRKRDKRLLKLLSNKKNKSY